MTGGTTIVKIGGSLFRSRALAAWLAVLARDLPGECVIVPGGGPFADTVRRAQVRHGFGDPVADRMAVFAMTQYGLMFTGIEPGLAPESSLEGIARVLRAGRTPVWLPHDVLEHADVEASWDVTSDSLAAWLAGRLSSPALVLVKSAPQPGPDATITRLVHSGIVDRRFDSFVRRARCRVYVCHRNHSTRFAKAMHDGRLDRFQVVKAHDPTPGAQS